MVDRHRPPQRSAQGRQPLRVQDHDQDSQVRVAGLDRWWQRAGAGMLPQRRRDPLAQAQALPDGHPVDPGGHLSQGSLDRGSVEQRQRELGGGQADLDPRMLGVDRRRDRVRPHQIGTVLGLDREGVRRRPL